MLNKARDDAGKQAQSSLHDSNNVVRMVTAGSKGSFINISQVGQPPACPGPVPAVQHGVAARPVWPMLLP